MRLGIFGGSFDPPHVGHVLVASDAYEALSLDRLVFVPNAKQPLKAGVDVTPGADRLAMMRLAVTGDDRFAVDPCEIARGGTSYSVDTLTDFAARYPDAARYFLIGADVCSTFSQWRLPLRVAALAQLAVVRRAGPDPLDDEAFLAPLGALLGDQAPAPLVVHTRRVDLSSTEVRDRVRSRQSIAGFVPDAVARFIVEHGLYQPRLQ